MNDEPNVPTFDQWLQYTFERRADDFEQINLNAESNDWDFDPQTEIEYIGRLFASPVEHTRRYTDTQINRALWRVISEGEPDLYELFNEELPLDLRIQVVKDMYIVFEQLFAPRCSPAVSAHQSQEHVDHLNPLNSICYMWWDIIPLYGKSGKPNREIFDPYCLEVMQRTIQLDSVACQESALHGLGHWAFAYPEQVHPIVDEFLKHHPDPDTHLHQYALAARRGMVL
jgi:hypothetical protein